MLAPDDAWVWDPWLTDDGERHHLFFLVAPTALGDPEARHVNASIGHAVSTDLRTWTRLPDALTRGVPGAFDDLATWTGSAVRGPDGTWFLFYTGVRRGAGGLVQTIGSATSPDLTTWTKDPANPILVPDGVHYQDLDAGGAGAAMRDPWVFPDPAGDGWHLLFTATAAQPPADGGGRGVVGHAWSRDLRDWELWPPLSPPGQGFDVLEVLQVERVDDRPVLVFSCPADETVPPVRPEHPRGDVWVAAATSPTGPYAISTARQLVTDGRYSGRLVRSLADGRWMLLAFDRDPAAPGFLRIGDPSPVRWRQDRLVVEDAGREGPGHLP